MWQQSSENEPETCRNPFSSKKMYFNLMVKKGADTIEESTKP